MKNRCRKSWLQMRLGPVVFLACGLAAVSALAWQAVADQEALSTELKAWKIISKEGKETRVAADRLGAGEILEYQVICKNNSSRTVTGIQPELPIPKGLELLPGTIAPKGALASLDGKKFSAIPLRRTVQAGGVTKEVPVPYSEYRYLRWSFSSLKPNQSVTVSARAKLAR